MHVFKDIELPLKMRFVIEPTCLCNSRILAASSTSGSTLKVLLAERWLPLLLKGTSFVNCESLSSMGVVAEDDVLVFGGTDLE